MHSDSVSAAAIPPLNTGLSPRSAGLDLANSRSRCSCSRAGQLHSGRCSAQLLPYFFAAADDCWANESYRAAHWVNPNIRFLLLLDLTRSSA